MQMNDVYVECLVKAKSSFALKVLEGILVVVTIGAGFLAMLRFVEFVIIAIVAAIAAYFVYLSSDVEYEYLYLDKEISIDKVMAKSKRKRIGTYTVDRMEILAPINSYHLDEYKNRNVAQKDYSAGPGEKADGRYVLYYEGGEKLILSPSTELVNALRNVAPRKVFLD